MMRPKLVAAVLAGGILVLGVGSAVAASLPSWTTHKSGAVAAASSTAGPAGSPGTGASPSPPASVSAPPAASPAATATPGSARTSTRSVKPRAARSITYTVKRGDTLSGIAGWFRLHGYGALYAANAAVIGDNPNLIIPGERITITNGVMKLSHAR